MIGRDSCGWQCHACRVLGKESKVKLSSEVMRKVFEWWFIVEVSWIAINAWKSTLKGSYWVVAWVKFEAPKCHFLRRESVTTIVRKVQHKHLVQNQVDEWWVTMMVILLTERDKSLRLQPLQKLISQGWLFNTCQLLLYTPRQQVCTWISRYLPCTS